MSPGILGLERWRLKGALWPPLRRGLLTAVPVGLCLLLDLRFEVAVAGALATGASMAGFVAFDAPARVRCVWQAIAAPVIGACAAIGVLSSHGTVPAIVAMALIAGAGGFCVAVSQRLANAGMIPVLALLVAQGLALSADEAVEALALGTAGGLLQALLSLGTWAVSDRDPEPVAIVAKARGARTAFASALRRGRESNAVRHAIRYGAALGAAVALYRFIDLRGHGYWVPLTVLFVLKPEAGDTHERLAMRAAGTVAGLILATAFAELLGYQVALTALVLALAAAFAYALLALEYALFTTAITVFVVLLADALGEPSLDAADERAVATVLGIAIAAAAFSLWPNREPNPAVSPG